MTQVSAALCSPVPKNAGAKAFATLVSAFTDDPVMRWLFPEPQQYVTHFPELLSAFGSKAFDEQSAWRLGEFSAVALWLPPNVEPDGDTIMTVLTEGVSRDKHENMLSILDQMEVGHPTYPHWYLPWFGVERTLQGRGIGAQLMTACLDIVDASHLPEYLETTNPRNITFYERHGFEVTGVAQAGAFPPVTFMLRAAH